ncbi:hypothetical protein [Verminephrobacter aporrectodeae]|uniref:hypothetical protein n=1 Tax=Verminephrobacter aporrectodeae TaxID=1110389 RepID=UPI002238DEEC|nr:hypothetical protein [Verminephrobacter aporrectodeae]
MTLRLKINAIVSLLTDPAPEPEGAGPDALVDRYRVQSHYLLQRCWLDAPPLPDRLATLPQVPTLLLHARIPHSWLRWIDGAGHDPAHPAMAAAMVAALDHYALHGDFGDGLPR